MARLADEGKRLDVKNFWQKFMAAQARPLGLPKSRL